MSPSGRIWLPTREPSGASPAARSSNPGLASAIRAWSRSRSLRSPHVRQTTSARLPCSSVTSRAARRLVQAVDVLGDDRAEDAPPLQVGDGVVGGVRLGVREALPADERAGPVPAAGRAGTGELAVLHRRDPAGAVGPAVVGDPAVGRHPGAREHERAGVRAEQRGERDGIRHTGDSRTGEPMRAPVRREPRLSSTAGCRRADSPVPPAREPGESLLPSSLRSSQDGSAGQEPRGRATPAPAVSSGPQRRGTGRSTTVHRLIRGAVAGAAALCLASIGTLTTAASAATTGNPGDDTITVDLNDSEAGGHLRADVRQGLRRHDRGRDPRLHLRPRGRARRRRRRRQPRPGVRPDPR